MFFFFFGSAVVVRLCVVYCVSTVAGMRCECECALVPSTTSDSRPTKECRKKNHYKGQCGSFFCVCVCCFFSGPPFVCRSLCAFATDASRMRATKKKKTAVTKSTGRYVDTAWSSAIFRTHRRCSCPISTTYLLIWAETRDVKYPQLCSDRGEQFIFFFSSFDSVVRAKIAGVRAASHIEVVHLFETFSGNLYEGARMTYVTVNYWLIE